MKATYCRDSSNKSSLKTSLIDKNISQVLEGNKTNIGGGERPVTDCRILRGITANYVLLPKWQERDADQSG